MQNEIGSKAVLETLTERAGLLKRRTLIADFAVLLPPLLLFLLFKAYTQTPASADENIYVYIGQAVWRGVVPYRDAFLAHPPFHLLIAVLWMLPGYLGAAWIKLAAIVPAAVSMLLVQTLLLKSGVRHWIVLLIGLLLAGSLDFLSVSSHFTGANWSMLLLVLGLCALINNYRRTASVLLASAMLVSFHIIPAIAGVVAADLLIRRREALKLMLMVAGFFIGVHFLCLLVFGDPYYQQVFQYHLMKTAMNKGGASSIVRFFHSEALLASLAALGLGFYLLRVFRGYRQEQRLVLPSSLFAYAAMAAVLQLVGVLITQRVYTYYLSPLLPLFAILSAWLFVKGYAVVSDAVKMRGESKPIKRHLFGVGISLLLLAVGLIGGEKLESRMGYYQREYGTLHRYDWQDSRALPDVVNRMVKALVYVPERRIGDVYNPFTRYLWHEVVTENPAPLLPALMKKAEIPGTLFGDASTVPYFALESGRAIALEQADTNAQIFKSGIIPMSDMLERLEQEPPAFLILARRRGIASHPQFRDYVKQHYRQSGQVSLQKGKRLQLWERR